MSLFCVSIPWLMWQIYGWAVPIVILAILYGFRWKAGMWSNSLSLGAALFSVLVAVGWWESLAHLIATQAPAMLFFADCLAVWTLFLVTFGLLDLATRFMSTIKVKYADMVENIGNGVVLFLLFLTLYGFFLFAEELGPVGDHANVSVQRDSMPVNVFRFLSSGNLSGFTQVTQFDSKGDFRELQLKRRQALMLNMMTGEGAISGLQGKEEQVNKIKDRNTAPPAPPAPQPRAPAGEAEESPSE